MDSYWLEQEDRKIEWKKHVQVSTETALMSTSTIDRGRKRKKGNCWKGSE